MPNQNSELINNQQQNANQVDAEYTAVVSGAGTTCEEKPVLKALLPGVRLHFLRYAYFSKKDDNVSACRVRDTSDDKFTLEDADASNGELNTTDNFIVARTPLNKGYVYLFNADDENDFHELEVDEVGNLSHIIWNGDNLKEDGATPKDFRTKGKSSSHYKLVKKVNRDEDKKYWIGYSEEQWSYDYHRKVLNCSDDDKRQKHMILVECKGVKKGEEEAVEHVLPYHKVEFGYYKDHGNQKIRETLKQIHQTEKREDRKGGNDTYEDMFITLHDPIGCATDLSEALSGKVLGFQALVDAIQTGETEQSALNRILGVSKEPDVPFDKNYQDMYTLALATFQMVYSSKENTMKYDGGKVGKNTGDNHFPHQQKPTAYQTQRGTRYHYPKGYVRSGYIGNGVHRDKVFGILGVDVRKKRREEVNVFRDEYGNFIQTDYFKNALKHYTENSPEHCLSGMAKIHEQILVLFNNPCNADSHMLINSEDEHIEGYKESDAWIDWIVETLEKECANLDDPLEKLLLDELSISEVLLNDKLSLMLKFAGATAAKLQIHSTVAYKTKVVTKAGGKIDYQKIVTERQTKILKRINKITVVQKQSGKIEKVFKFGNSHMIEFDASKMGVDFDPNLEVLIESPGDAPQKIVADSIKHKRLYGQKSMEAGGNHQFDIGDEVAGINKNQYKVNEADARNYNAKAAKFLNSRGFAGVMTGLQLINFTNAVMQLSDTFKDKDSEAIDKIKAGVNTVGVSADLLQGFMSIRKAHLIAIGEKVPEILSKNILRAGAIGGAITSAICIRDGIVAIQRDDEDAGVAWIGAGVAFGVGTAAAIWGTSAAVAAGTSIAILTGPVGWIALGIGMGLVALANILTDTELEYYFKHFVLCDRTEFAMEAGESPMDYNRRLYIARKTLVDYDEEEIKEKLTHPTDAIASMHDLTVCNTIQYHIPKDGYGDKIGSGHAAYRLGYEVTVSINFNQFLKSKNQLEAVGILLNSKGDTIGPFGLPVKQAEVVQLDNKQKQLVATLALPVEYKKKVNRHSKLVVALRVSIDEEINHYFPYPMQDGKTRYMGACIGLRRGMHGNAGSRDQEIIFETIDELKDEDTW